MHDDIIYLSWCLRTAAPKEFVDTYIGNVFDDRLWQEDIATDFGVTACTML